PRLFADHGMLSPFIFGLAEPADAQNQQFAIARRQRGFGKDVIAEYQPFSEQFWMCGECAEDIEYTPFHSQAFRQFTGFIVPLLFRQWFEARLRQAHEILTQYKIDVTVDSSAQDLRNIHGNRARGQEQSQSKFVSTPKISICAIQRYKTRLGRYEE